MSLTVIGIQHYPAKVKGLLQRKMIEIRTGTFVGMIDKERRDLLWKEICKNSEIKSNAYMVYQNKMCPSGFDFFTTGQNKRMPINLDGLVLVKYQSS